MGSGVANLKPYLAYRDSGVPWLGRVPEHWNVRRIKTLFHEKDERSGNRGGLLLSMTRANGIVLQSEASKRIASAEDLSNYKSCGPGDLVMNRMQAWSGMFALSPREGLVSPDYAVFSPVGSSEVKYFEYVFKAPVFVSQFAQCSKGIGSGFNRLYTPDFGAIPCVAPPLPEQVAIVRYLYHMEGRIRRYIRANQRLINLLEEQRQAIIHRAVTNGLDPAARLKPCGIAGLGNVAESVQRAKLGLLCLSIRDGTHNPPPHVRGEHRLLSVRNIVSGRFITRDDDRTMTPEAFADLERSYTVKEGDVVLALVGGTTGKSAVVEAMENVTAQRSIGILRPNPRVLDSQFLNFIISSQFVQSQIRQVMDKYAAQPGIYLNDVAALQILFPSLDTQHKVVAAVSDQSKQIDLSIRMTQREIGLLGEYRTRLIADVVTGKFDVREAAAKLPEEVEEPEPLDEDQGLDSGDEEVLDGDLDNVSEEAEE